MGINNNLSIIDVDYFITNDIKLKNVCSKENIEAIIIKDIED